MCGPLSHYQQVGVAHERDVLEEVARVSKSAPELAGHHAVDVVHEPLEKLHCHVRLQQQLAELFLFCYYYLRCASIEYNKYIQIKINLYRQK